MSDSIVEEASLSPDFTNKASMEDEEWETMKLMITDQLDNVTANLDDLRKKGCLESLAFQIERGDRCPSARLISWYLAMLEIEYCSRKEVGKKLDHMFQLHSTSKMKSFVLETHISRGGRPLEASDYRSIVEKLEAKQNLSITERQDLWLAKKNIRNEEAVIRKKEAEEKVRAQSAPNLERSRQSYKLTANKREIEPLHRPKSGISTASAVDGRKPPAIPSSTRSLTNITNKKNATESTVKVNKTKKRQPISDPFKSKK
jgi:hypothetical protein